MGETYAAAGVDIAAGEEAVERIKASVARTTRPGVEGGIGGFGATFALGHLGMHDPLLVSATDGVGTKAMVAAAAQRYDTIGIDLVAMCVDDLICTGARPLFFLDYISVGGIDPDLMAELVGGVADGCVRAECALIGGEMAEHPGAMAEGEFDLVGFAVGAVERDDHLRPEMVVAGDVLVGLHSPGLRSNGYSLARRLFFDIAGLGLDDPAWTAPDAPTVVDVLLEPSVIYAPAVMDLNAAIDLHGLAHITGGGIPGNLPRILPATVDAVVDATAWSPPAVFGELQRIGSVADDEMARTFNLGLGMIAALPAADADRAIAVLAGHDVGAGIVGEVVAGTGTARVA